MDTIKKTVFIIDDDLSIRRSLSMFLISNDFEVEVYTSSEEYLSRETFTGTGCILLDIKLDGKSGLQLQDELVNRDSNLPIIFMTGYGNVKMSVQTLKKGAFNFLEKPFNFEELLNSISEAMELCQMKKERIEDITKVKKLADTLSPREVEILRYLISGMLNKQIASELNIAEHTVKLHRHNISEKLGVRSVPEIVRIADKAGIVPVKNRY